MKKSFLVYVKTKLQISCVVIDQLLSTTPLLTKSELSIVQPSSVAVQSDM